MNVLKETTVVNGFFNGIEIGFTVGDCTRANDCIKVHNIRKIDDQHPEEIPHTLSLSDTRLFLSEYSKKDIFGYFNLSQEITKTMATKPNHKKQKTIKTNFKRRV